MSAGGLSNPSRRSRIALRLRRGIVNQFHRPHGLLGPLAGFVLARRPSNRMRNRWTVGLLEIAASHRVQILTASFDALPNLGGPFNRILAIYAVMFADDPEALLRDLVARLRLGGRLALTFQSRRAGARTADSERGGAEIAEALARAGLAQVRVEVLHLEPVAAVCVVGEAPAGWAERGR